MTSQLKIYLCHPWISEKSSVSDLMNSHSQCPAVSCLAHGGLTNVASSLSFPSGHIKAGGQPPARPSWRGNTSEPRKPLKGF